jgi:hypothetical protein
LGHGAHRANVSGMVRVRLGSRSRGPDGVSWW